MTYTTYFLKFSSQEEAELKLEEVGYKTVYTEIDETEKTVYIIPDFSGNIDIVGEIYNNDGEYNPETLETIKEPTKLNGWHVNIIMTGELPTALQEFIVTPTNPYRVFA